MTVSLSDMHLERAAAPAVLDGPVSIAVAPADSFARLVDLLAPQPKAPPAEQGKASQPDPGKSAELSAVMIVQAMLAATCPETLEAPKEEKPSPESPRLPEGNAEKSSIVAEAPPQYGAVPSIPAPLFPNVEPAPKRESGEAISILPARGEPAQKAQEQEQLQGQAQADPLPDLAGREARASVVTGPSLAGAIAVGDKTTTASADPPRIIHVDELSTHFPVMLANLASPSAPATDVSIREGAAPTTTPATPTSSAPATRAEPVKVLRFAIEPAELGALSVKIRVSHTRVEIRIDAQSSSAATLLVQARDALTAALDQKGMALQAFDVTTQVAPVIATSPTDGLAGGEANDRNAGFGAQSHASSGDGAGQDQRRRTPDQERRDPEKPPPLHGSSPAGVVL